MLNPPTKKPKPSDFGLEDNKSALSKAELNSFLEFAWMLIRSRMEYLEEAPELYTFLQERIDLKGVLKNSVMPEECKPYLQQLTRATDEFMALLTKTQQYRQELSYWNNYQSWKKNRNPARAKLEAKIGYDTKNLAHCIRLLRTGNEILLTGELNVHRGGIDAKQLLEIREGKVPYDIVTGLADELFKELDNSYEHSKLPHSANFKEIDEMTIFLVEMALLNKL